MEPRGLPEPLPPLPDPVLPALAGLASVDGPPLEPELGPLVMPGDGPVSPEAAGDSPDEHPAIEQASERAAAARKATALPLG
jgi:hypothetical protein